MSARRAFVLGAIVGAGVLAAVGAVSAGSSSSVRPQRRAETVPANFLIDLKDIDGLLTKLVHDLHSGKLDSPDVITRIARIENAKRAMIREFLQQPIYGLKASGVFLNLDCLDSNLHKGIGYVLGSKGRQLTNTDMNDITKYVEAGQKCKETLETTLHAANPPPEKLSLTTFPTWTHNTDIGKSNICINVETEPPQGFLSADVTGPGGFHTSLPKTPLHPDGTRQTGAEIAQAGEYKYTITVYDANGNATATTANTFTVDAPPQDGPTPPFGPPCPKPTQ